MLMISIFIQEIFSPFIYMKNLNPQKVEKKNNKQQKVYTHIYMTSTTFISKDFSLKFLTGLKHRKYTKKKKKVHRVEH